MYYLPILLNISASNSYLFKYFAFWAVFYIACANTDWLSSVLSKPDFCIFSKFDCNGTSDDSSVPLWPKSNYFTLSFIFFVYSLMTSFHKAFFFSSRALNNLPSYCFLSASDLPLRPSVFWRASRMSFFSYVSFYYFVRGSIVCTRALTPTTSNYLYLIFSKSILSSSSVCEICRLRSIE